MPISTGRETSTAREMYRMFNNKKEIEALKKEITTLKKKNTALEEKYKDKIIDDKANEEYRKKLEKEAKMSAELYKKNLDALVSKELNYGFLQQLINQQLYDNVIEIKLKDGTVFTIRPEKTTIKEKASDIYSLAGI